MQASSILNLPPGISSRDLIGGRKNGVAALIPSTITVKIHHGDEDECERCDRESTSLRTPQQLAQPSSNLFITLSREE